MKSKRLLPTDEVGNDDLFVKRLRAGKKKYSNLLIRVGPECEEFTFWLFPLVMHSEYLRRRVETVYGEERDGSTLTLDLPDFPHGSDILRMVQDFCCGVMEENDICTGNVVKALATSEFLGIESLRNRVWSFLETKVLNSPEECFKVLATFDHTNLPGIDVDHTREDCLFGRCKNTILPKQKHRMRGSEHHIVYSVTDLLLVAKLLPACVAERIYQSLIVEQSRPSNQFSLHFSRGVSKTKLHRGFCIYTCDLVVHFFIPVEYTLCPTISSDVKIWIEELQQVLPDHLRRSLLVAYLIKLSYPQNQLPLESSTIVCLELHLGFLSELLVEATELITKSDTNPIAPGLVEHIGYLEESLGQGLCLATKSADYRDLLLSFLLKFRCDTLFSIVRHFRSFCSDPSTILPVAKILDACLSQHLQEKSFTGREVFLIYQKFPNEGRPSHEELFQVFRTVWSRNDPPSQEALDVVKLLDYEKLSDETVERLFEEFQLDCGPPFMKRFVAMQVAKQLEKEKTEKELMSESKKLVESERDALRASKVLIESERDEMRRNLDEANEKTTCQICFDRQRDAVCLPCMHFLYCSGCLQQHHDRQSKTCPACRGFASGVLKCNLSA